jgi:MFS transporter, DHA1 family, tetracycline resistance protein
MRKHSASMAFILVTIIIDMLGIGLIVPILPKLIEQMSGGTVSDAAYFYGLITAVYALAQFVFSPVLGSLSDAYGRRRILLVGQAGLGLDYMIMALAPNLWWLAVARFISGILGASISTANAYIADVSTPENRARNFGLMGAAFGIGFVVGPVIGGILGEINLHLPFFFAAGLASINFLFGLFVLPESLKPENRRPFKGFVLNNPFRSIGSIRKYPPMIPLFISLGLAMLAQRGMESTWILYVNYRFDWGVRDSALSLAFVGIVSVIMQAGLVGRIVKHFGENRAMIGGYALSTLCMFLCGFATQGWMLFPLIAGHVAGNASAEPALKSLLSRNMPASEQGLLQGIIGSIGGLVIIIAPFSASMLLANASGPTPLVPLPGIWFVIASILYATALILLIRRKVQPPQQSQPHAMH